LVALIKGFLSRQYTPSTTTDERRRPPRQDGGPPNGLFQASADGGGRAGMRETLSRLKEEKLTEATAGEKGRGPAAGGELRYLGQLWNVYLAGTRGDDLILVDQHAAHERLLFDELSKKPAVTERLAIPIAVVLEEDESRALEQRRTDLEKLGFRLEATGGRTYEISALPSSLAGIPEKDLVDFLKGARAGADELERRVYALSACRAALKGGEALDPLSAHELMRKALNLPDPHCPHGRPVILRFSRASLDKLFQRDV
jgi:DNA mismatch repair protein MutL